MYESIGYLARQLAKQSLATIGLIICMLYLIAPVTTYAQDTNEAPLGFRDCSFTDGQTNAVTGENPITKCVGSILRFVFVVALFTIAIRVATLALNNYNPFSNGDANAQAIGMVWDVTVGLLLIGGPVIILSALNPALLNLDFVDQLGGIQSDSQSSNDASTTSSTETPPTDPETAVEPSIQGVTQTDLQTSVDNLRTNIEDIAQRGLDALNRAIGGQQRPVFGPQPQTPEDTSAATETNEEEAASNTGFWIPPFWTINTLAQDREAPTIEEQVIGEEKVRIVLNVEQECYQLLVPVSKKAECDLFFADFQPILDSLEPASREKLTPINDTKDIISGSFFVTSETTIRNVILEPQKITNTQCFLYSVVLSSANIMHSEQVYAMEICNNELPEQLFLQNKEGVIVPRTGEVLPAGTVVTQNNQVLYKLK